GIEEVAEHVHAAPVVPGRELDPGQERHAQCDGGVARLLPARGAVMVGQRQCANPVGVRLTDDLRGCLRAVGVVRVQMQVARSGERGEGTLGHAPSVPPGASEAIRLGFRTMLRLVGILISVLFAIATAVLVWPQFFRLEDTFPIAQIIASRALVLGAFLAIAVLALLLMLARPVRGFAASVLIIALLGAGATCVVGALRGIGT